MAEPLIVTNFEGFPERWVASDGTVGRSWTAMQASGFMKFRDDPSAVFVVNCDPRLLMELVARQLVGSGPKRPVVGVDVVLRKPKSPAAHVRAYGKSLLLRRVDRFVHYFRDTAAFDAAYRIPRDRSSFVDFKSNVWHLRADGPRPDGEYALCFGRSLRDYDTYFEAIERIGCPGAIVDPAKSAVWEHGSRFTRSLDELPDRVRLLEDDMSSRSQIDIVSRAKVVVIPIVKGTLVASGISTILNAMALGKCVIASTGPGVSDIFTDELLMVPPEDASALAEVLQRVWLDDELRLATARAGWEHANRCGSELDLFQRIVDVVTEAALLT